MSSKMITTRLEMKNYTRMSIKGHSTFIYTPDDHYALQMILGTNGCGKSSLQNELFPLPGDSNFFTLGGYKDHHIRYNNRDYRILSDFRETVKGFYEFWIDGVSLNEGGKVEMCRSLCFEHFGVNNEIRNLALGKERLTDMGPARRRYWMVKLADSDFTYSMKVYNELKDAHRDATGSIKRMNKRLVDEMSKLVDKSVSDEMTKESNEIKKLINELYSHRNATTDPSDSLIDQLERNAIEMDDLVQQAQRINVSVLETTGVETREELVKKIEEITIRERESQTLMQYTFANHREVEKKYHLMHRAGTETLAELTTKREGLIREVEGLKAQLVFPSIELTHNALETQSVFEHIYADLFDKLSNLPSNESGYYVTGKRDQMLRVNQYVYEETLSIDRTIAKLTADIEHRESHVISDTFTCPQCNHKWTTKATEEDIAKVKEKIKELEIKKTELQERKKANDEYIGEFEVFDKLYREIMMIVNGHRILSPFLNYLLAGNRLMMYPSAIATDLYSVRLDLEKHAHMQRCSDQIEKINEQIELKSTMDAQSIESVEKEMEELSRKLTHYQTRVSADRAEIRTLQGYLSTYDLVESRRKDMRRLHDRSLELGKQYAYSRYQELLTHAIMGLQTQLARKEDALSTILHQQQIVEDIQSQIDLATMHERVAKAAHQALSPTTGAIAEGLRRFNNIFVNRMNKVIGAIWSYPLEIQATEMEDGQVEMDYKFPFVRNGKGRPFKDVSEGSESMLDIFDFAFRICALRQLGLGHLPLFLDEFEAAFDVAHREAAIYFIKRLLDEDHYGQIFMVSHYESNHGALSNLGQTCILDATNVMLSTNVEVNKNVMFA